MKPIHVYGLIDPRQPHMVRYIGQSNNLIQRLSDHRRNRERSPLGNWAQSLREQEVIMSHILLDTVNDEQTATERETFWIRQYDSDYLLNSNKTPSVVRRLAEIIRMPNGKAIPPQLEKVLFEHLLREFNNDVNALHDSGLLGYSLNTIKARVKEYVLGPKEDQLKFYLDKLLLSIETQGKVHKKTLIDRTSRDLNQKELDDILNVLVTSGKIRRDGDLYFSGSVNKA